MLKRPAAVANVGSDSAQVFAANLKMILNKPWSDLTEIEQQKILASMGHPPPDVYRKFHTAMRCADCDGAFKDQYTVLMKMKYKDGSNVKTLY